MAKIERKLLAHYLNVKPGDKAQATYFRIGKDLEELSVEMSAEIESKKNILGETSVALSSYEVTAGVEPYYADKGDGCHEFLQDIVDNRKVLDDCKTDAVEVHLWTGEEASTSYTAYKESVVVEVTSYGGDSTGYQIPYNLHYLGDRVKGKFDIKTKTFTPDEE